MLECQVYHITTYPLCILYFWNVLGNLPDIGETVTRTACVRTTDDRPCVRSYEIEIKHCVKDGEEYNVYNLQTPVAADKYCFGK